MSGSGRERVPFGPCTAIAPSCRVTDTPAGSTMSFFPILDMTQCPRYPADRPRNYHTKQRTSPPTFSSRASLSVTMPREVDRMAMP